MGKRGGGGFWDTKTTTYGAVTFYTRKKPEETHMAKRGELGDIWKGIVDFNDRHFPGWSHEDLRLISNALAGEVGELCDATKHFYGGGTNPKLVSKETTAHMAEEAFDVMVYLVLLLGAMGYGQSRFCEVARRKLAVLEARMVKQGFCKL